MCTSLLDRVAVLIKVELGAMGRCHATQQRPGSTRALNGLALLVEADVLALWHGQALEGSDLGRTGPGDLEAAHGAGQRSLRSL